MSVYWLEVNPGILDNAKIARLPDNLWRFFFELALACAKDNLETIPDECWKVIGCPRDQYESMLSDLIDRGIMAKGSSLWFPINSVKWKAQNYSVIAEYILNRDSYACAYCGGLAEHIDHVIPQCQGGSDEIGNLVAACAKCNMSKGGRTPDEWRAAQDEQKTLD